jgi:hypothetical protein
VVYLFQYGINFDPLVWWYFAILKSLFCFPIAIPKYFWRENLCTSILDRKVKGKPALPDDSFSDDLRLLA